MRKHHGGRLLGALIICASATLLTVGCKKKEEAKTDSKPAPSASVDRLADGKRLEKSVADWTKRWNDFAPLPTCEKLLEAADLQLCTATDAALTALKTAVAEKKPEGVLMHAAAELALAAEQANEKLRAVVQEKAAKEAAAPGAKPAAAKAATPPPAKPTPPGSAKLPAMAERLRSRADAGATPPNPDNAVVEAYGRASRLALRYLSTYLQYGPLPTRQAAYAEFEQLSNKRPAWPGLLRSLREASLMEKEPALSAKLKDLVNKLRALQPKPTLPASGAIPSGHPPLPGMKAPAAGGPVVRPPPPPGAPPPAAPAPPPAAPPQ